MNPLLVLHASLQFSLNPLGVCQGEQEGSRVQLPCPLSLSAGSRKAGGPFSHSLQSKQLLESPVLGFRAGPRSLPWSLAVNEEAVSYVGQTGS